MNNINPKISVVIPAFNEEKYLSRCLSSLKEQTFKDFEIIVVDNNSTDRTSQIAMEYGAKVIKEMQKGTVFARETGFRLAKAPIIARTDADATVPHNWLNIIYNTFISNPKVVAVSGAFTSEYKRIPDTPFKLFTKIFFKNLAKLWAGHVLLIGANMAVRKTAWQQAKPHITNKYVHEDVDLSCHLARYGKILYIPNLFATCSLRRIQEKPFKGIFNYLVVYFWRHVYTVLLHHPLPKIVCQT